MLWANPQAWGEGWSRAGLPCPLPVWVVPSGCAPLLTPSAAAPDCPPGEGSACWALWTRQRAAQSSQGSLQVPGAHLRRAPMAPWRPLNEQMLLTTDSARASSLQTPCANAHVALFLNEWVDRVFSHGELCVQCISSLYFLAVLSDSFHTKDSFRNSLIMNSTITRERSCVVVWRPMR